MDNLNSKDGFVMECNRKKEPLLNIHSKFYISLSPNMYLLFNHNNIGSLWQKSDSRKKSISELQLRVFPGVEITTSLWSFSTTTYIGNLTYSLIAKKNVTCVIRQNSFNCFIYCMTLYFLFLHCMVLWAPCSELKNRNALVI